MKNLLETSSTSSYDFKLFRKLGLEKFEFSDQEEHFLGEHIFNDEEDTRVKIFVTCLPSQFWRFEIKNPSGDIIDLSTGSGHLSDFWKLVEQFGTGMVGLSEK